MPARSRLSDEQLGALRAATRAELALDGALPGFFLPEAGARLVTGLIERVQRAHPGLDPLPIVERLYSDLCIERFGWTADVARQSWVAASGSSFQGVVRSALNTLLGGEGVRAVNVAELGQYAPALDRKSVV